MRITLGLLLALSVLAACSNAPELTTNPPAPTSISTDDSTTFTPEPASVTSAFTNIVTLTMVPTPTDFFTRMGITPPAPVCNSLTQSQTEGPYYIPDTPERHSLLEDGMPGTRLVLVGYVLDQNCQPLANAWLDFWQADSNGEYDNTDYSLRGHQFTDPQGRYYLETILPGLYSSRPIEHIHVKVQPAGGEVVTSQLYFPAQPIEGLTIQTEDKGDYLLGYFNFVIQG
jgi:protocatechuate 3,4-dioxygenase beta subunit